MATRHPPAVSFPVRRSAALAVAISLLALSGACVLGAWALSGAYANKWSLVAGWIGWALAVVTAALHWRAQPTGMLRWDGDNWSLQVAGHIDQSAVQCATPVVLLDAQRYLWVWVRTAGGATRWLLLERACQPDRWLDVRRAVYSPAGRAPTDADTTAPAGSCGRES